MNYKAYLRASISTVLLSVPQTSSADIIKFPPISLEPHVSLNAFKKSLNTTFDKIEASRNSSSRNVFKKAFPSVVKIVSGEAFGTGVIISNQGNGLVLTNHHVIEGNQSVAVVFPTDRDSDRRSLGNVIKVDEISDLALIHLAEPRIDIVPINISEIEIEIGDDVHALGHPYGEDWTYTRGYVSQLRKNYSWSTGTTSHHVADIIQTQTPINPGNSGGPLLNNNAELVGINTFVNSVADGLNYSLDLKTVGSFLSSEVDRIRISFAEDSSIFGKLINSADENKNGNPDFYLYDLSYNQVVDRYIVDNNEDLLADKIFFDENENSIIELSVSFEVIEGDAITVYQFDDDEDGVFDHIGLDTDQDGNIDHIEPIN
ncbi:trypsin-like peptidase domain-containing protein [Planktomarina temperata]|nr:trypsin-like peptidase domain-containing protein [Planktomarina temperata]